VPPLNDRRSPAHPTRSRRRNESAAEQGEFGRRGQHAMQGRGAVLDRLDLVAGPLKFVE
jgi:hypothetical protein